MELLKNKKGWTTRNYLIATLVFSGIIVMMYLMVASIADDYSNPSIVDENFRANFDQFQNNTQDISDIFTAASSKEGLSLLVAAEIIFGATFSVIGIIFSSVGTVGIQISNFAQYFGIPTEVANIIFPLTLAALTIMIVFIVISAVNRTEKL
jgi:hypothetical protein